MHHTYVRRGHRAVQVALDNWPRHLARAEEHVRQYYREAEILASKVIDPSYPQDPATRHAESQFLRGIGMGILLDLKLLEEAVLSGRPYLKPFLDRVDPARRVAA